MKKRTPSDNPTFPAAWLPVLQSKVRPPVCVVLGSPRQVTNLVQAVPLGEPVLYQMDLYQAERTHEMLGEYKLGGMVATHPDLWDLGDDFQTAIFLVDPKGERILKLDMIEQAYHVLKPHGTLIVLSRQTNDDFFPTALKKIYGRVHAPQTGTGTVLWCQREEDRPRRRHEVTFHVSGDPGAAQWHGQETVPQPETDAKVSSLRFVSRPGVFSYGRFDNGARALVETAVINAGDNILDIGCGCGTNGIICGLRGGPSSHVTFADSNSRATVLTKMNAVANGLKCFELKTCCRLNGMTEGSFDVVLANPPYFASLSIAQAFVEQSRPLLKKGGRLYLVTKQPTQVGPMVAEHFGVTEAVERRGYVVLCAIVD
jgi:23S rRNA (guanine1835-N2)-methyltransferase